MYLRPIFISFQCHYLQVDFIFATVDNLRSYVNYGNRYTYKVGLIYATQSYCFYE